MHDLATIKERNRKRVAEMRRRAQRKAKIASGQETIVLAGLGLTMRLAEESKRYGRKVR